MCAKFGKTTIPLLKKAYVDGEKLAIVFRHFPLEKIHPLAFGAAASAECASAQGRFWPMHDLLFQSKGNLKSDVLTTHVKSLGLDATEFRKCVEVQAPERIRADVADGLALSVRGTPSLFVGLAQPGEVVKVTAKFGGIPPGTALVDAIDAALARAAQ